MRRAPFPSRRSATVTLLIVNVVAFLAQIVLSSFLHYPTDAYFALSLEGLRHGFVWQLLTYQFMHGGVIHLLLNCWAIFMFGREVEEALGRKNFLTLYFSSGVMGGLVQMLAGLLLGGHFAVPVVGASAGAFGLIAAFAVLFPERPLTLLLFFIIPVNMRAKFLLLISALVALLGIAFPISNIADAAHLGGMFTGSSSCDMPYTGNGRGSGVRHLSTHARWSGSHPTTQCSGGKTNLSWMKICRRKNS